MRDELLRRFPALATLPPHTEVVGGAVRDLMLRVEPADVDVECDEPLGCASRVGKVITLGRGDLQVYRVVLEDRIYDFSRRMDLGRRDFTMNAIAIDLTSGEMRDPFDGVADIERRSVRMISPGNFQDDPLRMLRAVRLAVQFDFAVDAETIAAIRRRAGQIVTCCTRPRSTRRSSATPSMRSVFTMRWCRWQAHMRCFFAIRADSASVGNGAAPCCAKC